LLFLKALLVKGEGGSVLSRKSCHDNSCSFFGKQEFAAIQIGSLQGDIAAKLVSVPNCTHLIHSIVIPTFTQYFTKLTGVPYEVRQS
jgi:hypothetical protein